MRRRAPLALWLPGGTLLALILGVALGPLVWPVPPEAMDLTARNAPPGAAHPLGTDRLGRDMLARLMAGGRLTLSVGLAAMALSVALGTAIGGLAGLWRALDGWLMRLTDLFLSLPVLPLLLVAVMLFRDALTRGLGDVSGLFLLIVVAIGATSWMPTARVVRALVLGLMQRDFITAAIAGGATRGALVLRHILPHCASAILVSGALGVANAIVTESALSFLGVGFPPDTASWGRMLADGAAQLADRPAQVIWPGAMISLTVLCVTYLGDGLRDRLDRRA
ncbi:ABC transporter permease [Roseovarius sp. SCSIO 43702]|uniref:ABC transporter permease n=1 Tax=Roseovarius sp. SCSIO 43702 TaxID=2823043 RepID=UPI001C72E7F5|nr:ABC transporter permease [Roseovarius sp. SCSIO 43702]QYX58187.1 ABC transporter permease [Roseovarius sp. SCSIO 43702]